MPAHRIVALHGWSLDDRIWDVLRVSLHGRVELLTPKLPGHGGVPVDLCDRSLADYHATAVEAFGAWCSDNRVSELPMVAWAWGSQVLVDAVAQGLVSPRSVALVSFAAPFQTPATYAAVMRDWPRFARKLVGMMTAQPLSADMHDWLVSSMCSTSLIAVAGVQSVSWEPPAPELDLPPNSVAITGAGDRLTPASTALPLLDAWGVTTTVLDGVGHMPFVEDRTRFEDWLMQWIETVDER